MWPSKVAAESAFENGLSKLLVGEGWGSGGSLPPVSIPEKSYEPYDDGRSLLLVAYLAAVRGAVCYDTLILVFKLVISGCRIVSLVFMPAGVKTTPPTGIARCYEALLATARLFTNLSGLVCVFFGISVWFEVLWTCLSEPVSIDYRSIFLLTGCSDFHY